MAEENLIKKVDEPNSSEGNDEDNFNRKRKTIFYEITEQGNELLDDYEKHIISQTIDILMRNFRQDILKLIDSIHSLGVNRILYYVHTYQSLRENILFSLIYPYIVDHNIKLFIMSQSPIPKSIGEQYPHFNLLGAELEPRAQTMDLIFSPDLYLFSDNQRIEQLNKFNKLLIPEPGFLLFFDMFLETEGNFSFFIKYLIKKMDDLVPPMIPLTQKNIFREIIESVFPNLLRIKALDINLLVSVGAGNIHLKEFVDRFIKPERYPYKIEIE